MLGASAFVKTTSVLIGPCLCLTRRKSSGSVGLLASIFFWCALVFWATDVPVRRNQKQTHRFSLCGRVSWPVLFGTRARARAIFEIVVRTVARVFLFWCGERLRDMLLRVQLRLRVCARLRALVLLGAWTYVSTVRVW